MTLAPGTRLGRYEIRSHIGTGGMGEVYAAMDTELERTLAIKILPDKFVSDRMRIRRFIQEARAASGLNHPNIITIHEIKTEGSTPFIVTEFIDGMTLRQRLLRARISVGEAIGIALQIGSALDAAHRAGIVHRDIKPENIMLRTDGYVKVLDFGLARPTEQHTTSSEASTLVNTEIGTIIGTAQYMSPEQARGQKVDGRTDIFSLGVVLYEMIAHKLPFEGSTNSDVVASILKEEPAPLVDYAPDVPLGLQEIVSRALAKDKDDRYERADQLIDDLRKLRQELDFEFQLERPNRIDLHQKPGAPTATMPAPVTADVQKGIATKASKTLAVDPGYRKRVTQIGAFVVLIGIAIAAYFYFAKENAAIDSVAVLPFTYTNADQSGIVGADVEWLSDGITESIINSLSRVPSLKVIARSSVFRYKGKTIDPQTVGRELKVRAVVTGKVVQMGDTLSIQTELVDVKNQTQLWGEKYKRKVSDVLNLPEDISQQISDGLKIELTGEEKSQLAKRYTQDPRAYELYWKGRYYWNQRRAEDIKEAIKDFQEAIRIDPQYALAYTGLADCYVLGNVMQLPPKEAMPIATDAARKALAIDNNLAEAHTSLAKIKLSYEWDWTGAETEFKQAIKINPGYATAHQWYGVYLSEMGRHDESISERTIAQELDPLSLSIATGLARAMYWARRYDEAIQNLQAALAKDQTYADTQWSLGLAYEQKKMYPEAITAFQKAVELSKTAGSSEGKPEMLGALGHAYALAGQKNEAARILDQLNRISISQRYGSPYSVALIYVALDEKDEAFAWLGKAYNERDENFIHLKVDPRLDSIRSDSRFQDWLQRIRLAS